MLRCYIVVAEELHFARAARRLLTTQATVSRTVRSFERQLGVELLSRNSRQVEMTEAGELMLLSGRDVLERYQALMSKVLTLNTSGSDRPNTPQE